MRKKQKISKKKKSQKVYKDFIYIVKWWKYDFILASHISNIYDDNDKKEVEVYRLPIWRDITDIQKLAYFLYFMSETKAFTCLKPFTLDFSKEFRDRYKNLSYKELKAVIIKRMYGNLDYQLQSISKPMMSFILENKPTYRRKDINDKETHIHGIREVFDENIDSKVRLALKTSVCNRNKEYKRPEYRNMLHTNEKYDDEQGPEGWMRYLNKGVCSNNGLYISDSLLEKIRNDYNQLYNEYVECIKYLRSNGVKVKYINVK
ncbi:MAG: hypothetical protein IJS26_02000 [Alphaproteobacteria bacterium]|nr:hypothetical protein [Alphaproteobacteria bacterium]